MPTARKEELVDEIKGWLNGSEAVILVDYRGLTVKEMQELRGKTREAGGEVKIYKNSLTEIAIRELALPSMGSYLEGPTAFVFIPGDPVAPAKALSAFSKEHHALEFKGGLVQNRVVDASDVKAIAKLPSYEGLIASLLGTMQNPLTGTVRVLSGPAQAFVTVLDAIAKEKAA
ncbi:MAG: 50S ribosomal protein L10 [Coriobacteriia bacterium]|nr:50S ribosomal protein L10 [Coriobacteriia bacterium]